MALIHYKENRPHIIVNNIYCFLLFFLRADAASISRGKKGWEKKNRKSLFRLHFPNLLSSGSDMCCL